MINTLSTSAKRTAYNKHSLFLYHHWIRLLCLQSQHNWSLSFQNISQSMQCWSSSIFSNLTSPSTDCSISSPICWNSLIDSSRYLRDTATFFSFVLDAATQARVLAMFTASLSDEQQIIFQFSVKDAFWHNLLFYCSAFSCFMAAL